MVVVVSIIVRNNIVASEVDCVSSRDLEEDVLVLGNGNVKGLLIVLRKC